MDAKKKNARIAGLLYLLIAITGGFGIMYAPSSIIVIGDTKATATNIVNNKILFNLSILSNLVSQALTLFLALSLFSLLKNVNKKHAIYMVVLVLVAVPISFLNVNNLIAVEILVSGADYLNVFDINQLNTFMLLFLNLYEYGIYIVGVFWGLWLFPFGMLIIKSKFIPKIIGVFLIIGCVAYLVDSVTSLMLPEYKDTISPIMMLPLAIGEFSIIFWLLIKGVRQID